MTTDLKKLAEVERWNFVLSFNRREPLAVRNMVSGKWVQYSDHQAAIAILQQEVETLRGALEIYGEHKVNCKADRRIGDCDCGLAEALQHTGEDGETKP